MADVSVAFGAVKALDGVTLAVREGAFVGLIGPNGAGKTTFFNVVSGFVAPTRGRVRLGGHCIDTWSPAKRARAGLARTFQNIGLDKQATVADNLKVARQGGSIGDELRVTLGLRRGEAAEFRAEALIERLELEDVLGERVNELPVGTAKLVELVTALCRQPRLLLLDEPASGLGPPERVRLGELLRDLHRDEGTTILMIEHDMALAMSTRRVSLRPRLRHAAGRGSARGDPARPAGHRGVPRQSGVEAMSDVRLRAAVASSRYGSVEVLHDVTVEVGVGEIVAVLGANGAGKTTLLRTISGRAGEGDGRAHARRGGHLPPLGPGPGADRCRARPRGAAGVPRPQRPGEPRGPRLRPQGGGRRSAGLLRPGLRPLPPPGRTPRPAGGVAVGRRSSRCWPSAGR